MTCASSIAASIRSGGALAHGAVSVDVLAASGEPVHEGEAEVIDHRVRRQHAHVGHDLLAENLVLRQAVRLDHGGGSPSAQS